MTMVTLIIVVQAIGEEDFVRDNDSEFNVTENFCTDVPELSRENRALIEGLVVNEEVIYAHWNSWELYPEPNVLLEAGYEYEVTFVSDNYQGIPGWNYNGRGTSGTNRVNPNAPDYVRAPGPCWITLYDPDYSCWHGLPKEAKIEDFEFDFAVEPGKSVVRFTIRGGATTFYNTDQRVDNSGSANMIIVRRPVGEDARKYAPNLWFGSTEELYPTRPFFDDDDPHGEDNKNDYYALSFEQKMDNFVVYYHKVDTGEEVVYEYWFYYAYNNWRNEHYHDWETVYVFVNKSTEEVTRVVASAHVGGFINNMLEEPQFAAGEHAGILVEEGSHASCTDRNNNGLFETTVDITNWYICEPTYLWPFAWGIRGWDEEDQVNGHKIIHDNPYYNLKEITSDFISKFGGLKGFDDPTLGFPVEVPILGGIDPVKIGGEPPTHPWHQTRYENPYEIIPFLDRFITGTLSGSDTTGAIVVILSEDPYYTFADENGSFLLNNIPDGVYDAVVNLHGHAPYKQRFIHKENTTLGVNGILYLIPEDEAFRLEGIVTDAEGNSIPDATINIYDGSGTQLFTTLTNEDGTYLVTVSEKQVYTVEAITDTRVGLARVTGTAGSVAHVDITIGKGSIVAYIDTELMELIEAIEDLDLTKGQKNSLLGKLEDARSKNGDALRFIEDGKEKQANNMLNAEDNIMNAFINEVEAQSGKKIGGHDADHLRAEAAAMRALIQVAIETPI